MQAIYHRKDDQATITTSTLRAVLAIIADSAALTAALAAVDGTPVSDLVTRLWR